MGSRTAIVAAALLALPATGCFTKAWGAAMDARTFREKGPPGPSRGPYQPFGEVATATVSGAPADFFRVPDLVVLNAQHRSSRGMVVAVPRGDSRLPAVLVTPAGSGSPVDGDVAAAATRCWRDAGFAAAVDGGASAAVPAMLVVARGEDGIARLAAERAPDRPWPRGEGGARVMNTIFAPFVERPTPWTLVAVRLGPGWDPAEARIAVWQPAGPERPASWAWGAPRPVRDCLERSSGWPQFWKGIGFVGTIPLDIVTFPLQVILHLDP